CDGYMGSYQLRGLLCNIYKNENCTIEERYYRSALYAKLPADTSSSCVEIDPDKCILCGECVRTCEQVQSVGAVEIRTEGGVTRVMAAGGGTLADTDCVGCGQCHAACPTGALRIKTDVECVKAALADENAFVVAQVAPSVRVGVGGRLGFPQGENSMPRLVGLLRALGFDRVYDTVFSADLTVMEEADEFLERFAQGEKLPLLTSCCPAWVKFCEERWPEFAPNISTCRSPQQMLGAVIRAWFDQPENRCGKRLVVVSIMPCTAKKAEILRPESKTRGVQDVDYSLTTSELLELMEDAGLGAGDCPASQADAPFSSGSGGGTLFGATGGVTEAVLRRLSPTLGFNSIDWISESGVRGFDGVKCATVTHNGLSIRVAVVSGLANADALLRRVKDGEEQFDLIEVMSCPGGCVMGGGQPADTYEAVRDRTRRSGGLYGTDAACPVKSSQDNASMRALWDTLIRGREHELLHRNFTHI
ncbi:MAG: [FeFe] hydrogenase, group A, partial [Oscillospiraceae bacterium]